MNTNTPIKPADEPSSVTVQWALPARYIAAGLFIIGVIALLAFLSPIGADLAAGFLLAFLLDIPARALAKRTRLTYPRAAILIYLVIYVILAVLLIVGFNFFVEATQNILSDLKPAAESMFDTLENTSSQAILGVDNQALSKLLEAAFNFVVKLLSLPLEIYGSFAITIVHLGFSVFLSNLIVLSVYSGRGFLKKWTPQVFVRESALVLTWLDTIWGRYLLGMAIFAIVLGLGSMVEFWLLGVPYPVILGIFTGLVSLIPFVGGLISDIVVAIPCLLLGSTRFPELSPVVFAITVAIINGLITQISYNFIALPIIGKLVKLPFWVILTGVMLGSAINSILFAFLVIPIFSTIRVLGTYLLSKISGIEPFPGEAEPTQPIGFFSQMLLGD